MKFYIDKENRIMFVITPNYLSEKEEEALAEKLTESTPYRVFAFGNTESIELF
ncbi:hypothetical protein P3T86_09780 [Staphylococcus nepalensis]|uniref:hypothetical protein n=1 Tax=Staphylococcus nepalensis TaxID=214473 RepID=UPI002B25BDC4|nr:hypothetical protein [Staphylococcus nepalensis]WQL19476.1 hypothetical protein P3T86_09780 [Staphylococcus nepalensis]